MYARPPILLLILLAATANGCATGMNATDTPPASTDQAAIAWSGDSKPLAAQVWALLTQIRGGARDVATVGNSAGKVRAFLLQSAELQLQIDAAANQYLVLWRSAAEQFQFLLSTRIARGEEPRYLISDSGLRREMAKRAALMLLQPAFVPPVRLLSEPIVDRLLPLMSTSGTDFPLAQGSAPDAVLLRWVYALWLDATQHTDLPPDVAAAFRVQLGRWSSDWLKARQQQTLPLFFAADRTAALAATPGPHIERFAAGLVEALASGQLTSTMVHALLDHASNLELSLAVLGAVNDVYADNNVLGIERAVGSGVY